jgi:Tfp pilus assembly PilM family ATPase
MFTKTFFKVFPPPKFLDEPYAGVDISDNAVHCIQFASGSGKLGRNGGLVIAKYGVRVLEPGIVEAGFIKEQQKLTEVVADLARELSLDRVRASLPEEEMYIFKTPVPSRTDRKTIAQNVEFKLEENVPLSPADAIFYFDTIPDTESLSAGTISASVAVAPRKVVETYLEVLTNAGLTVISFEMQARSLARAFIGKNEKDMKNTAERETVLIVNIFSKKIGMYVIYDTVACFTSTISRGDDMIESIRVETQKIRDYWAERGEGKKEIDRIIISGKDALTPGLAEQISPSPSIRAEVANVWNNAFSTEESVAPITAEDSLDYAVAAGLALPLKHFS